MENGSNRSVGDTRGEGQWVMVSLLLPPTHKGGALSWLLGNRGRRTASSSVGPVGRESGSANCCHLVTGKHGGTQRSEHVSGLNKRTTGVCAESVSHLGS